MYNFALLVLVFPVFTVGSSKEEPRLSAFQTQIQVCQVNVPTLHEVKSFGQLYKSLSQIYLLVSERILYRELIFLTKDDRRKIKVTDDKIELFRVDADDRHTALEYSPRQKKQTVASAISELTLNHRIESNWEKRLEKREKGLTIEYVRDNERLTQMTVRVSRPERVLECMTIKQSEICVCRK
jgi:hypothetical protein